MERLASFKDSENRLTVERLRCTCLLRFSPCYKSGGGWSGKCSETGEVTISLCGMKSSNHRHLLITFCGLVSVILPCRYFKHQINLIGKIKFVLIKNSLYICIMKRQIQSYISEEDYSKLKLIAEKEGLLFATLIRQIILNYLKTKKL